MSPFAGSPSEGTLRPHTAPERLGPCQGEEYHRSAARSRSGAGGRHANGGKGTTFHRGNYSPERAFDAWPTEKKKARKKSGKGGGSCRTRHNNAFRYPSPVARLPSTASTAWGQRGDKRALLGPGWRGGGGGDTTRELSSSSASVAGDGAFGGGSGGDSEGGDCLSRTHIIGMNGGRLPREVRQVPVDRPLTAPCGKVGRQRVRARSAGGPGNH